jgi:hypothetical protein
MTLPIHLKKPPTCPSYRADANFTVGCNFRRDLRAGGVGRAFPDTVAVSCAQEPGPSRYESRTCVVLRGSIRILQTTTITTDHAMNMIVAACAVIGTNAIVSLAYGTGLGSSLQSGVIQRPITLE